MQMHNESKHIVIIRRGQFCKSCHLPSKSSSYPDWFDCLDSKYRPLLSDREILTNLEAVVRDSDKTPVQEVRSPTGF
jgi:carnitine O-acetyltransferase